jgi:hypothetical protein
MNEQTEWLFNTDLDAFEQEVEGVGVKSGYLKPGETFSLLAIGQTEPLLETGIMDVTDAIDPAISLGKIVIQYTFEGKRETLYLEVGGEQKLPLTDFVYRPEGNYRELSLNFSTMMNLPGLPGAPVMEFHAIGAVNLELGNTYVSGSVKIAEEAQERISDAKFVGYTLNANRVNHNRRVA